MPPGRRTAVFRHLTVFRNHGRRFDWLRQGRWWGLALGPIVIIHTPWTVR